jgi:DNA-binding beta-propeller fold protein YncE
MLRSLILPALLLAMPVLGQYSGPESVEYDPVGDRYFVSNTGSNQIRVRAQDGTVSTFASVSPAPYGLEIMGDTLFACSGGGVKGYLLSNGSQVFNRALGATFCNGITTDGRYLYITDFSGGRIYKVDALNTSHTTLVSSTGGSPNGIVWDPIGERLVVVFWGSNAPIRAYDRETGAATTLVTNSGLGNIDGVTIDCNGNFITANWSPARISRWAPNFQGGAVNLNVTGLGNPADIDFDAVNDRICIPNSSSNTVLLVEVDCSTGVPETGEAMHRLLPNPVADRLSVEPPLKERAAFLLIDQRGSIAASGQLDPGAQVDVMSLAPGAYTLVVPSVGLSLRFVRVPPR